MQALVAPRAKERLHHHQHRPPLHGHPLLFRGRPRDLDAKIQGDKKMTEQELSLLIDIDKAFLDSLNAVTKLKESIEKAHKIICAKNVKLPEDTDEATIHMAYILETKLIDLGFSKRVLNIVAAAEVETLGELVAFTKEDLWKFRAMGRKSIIEIEEKVKSCGLELGMNISRYSNLRKSLFPKP